jgi:hypothetical protein
LRVGRRVLRRARVQPLAMTPADTLDTTTPDTTTGATR